MTATFPPPSPVRILTDKHGGPQTPTLVVMHATVSPTRAGMARAIARMFRDSDRDSSAHYVVDEAEVIQCVGDHRIAWHCGYNADSLAIEMCFMPLLDSLRNWLLPADQRTGDKVGTHARIIPLRWLQPAPRRMFRRSVNLAGDLCLSYGIRPRYIGVRKVRAWDAAGRPAALGGITTHAVMTKAFRRSTHWDPGAWPRRLFIRRVRRHVEARRAAVEAAA
jgi:hypothetical protein